MRENCTYSLSGGRWLARKRATSDPTGYVVGKASEALRSRKGESTDRPSRERWRKARTIGEVNRARISRVKSGRKTRNNWPSRSPGGVKLPRGTGKGPKRPG